MTAPTFAPGKTVSQADPLHPRVDPAPFENRSLIMPSIMHVISGYSIRSMKEKMYDNFEAVCCVFERVVLDSISSIALTHSELSGGPTECCSSQAFKANSPTDAELNFEGNSDTTLSIADGLVDQVDLVSESTSHEVVENLQHKRMHQLSRRALLLTLNWLSTSLTILA